MSGWRSCGPSSRVTRVSRTSGVFADQVEDRFGVVHRVRVWRNGQRGRAAGRRARTRWIRRMGRGRTVGWNGIGGSGLAGSVRSRRPFRMSSQVRRSRSRRGWSGRVDRPRIERLDDRAEPRGEPIGQAVRELELLAGALRRAACRPSPARGARRPSSRAGPGRPSGDRGRAPPCRPCPGRTIGAPVRSAMSAEPIRNGPIRPGGPLIVPSGIWAKTRAVGDDRPRGGDVLLDPDAAAPDRQQAADPMDERLAPARPERRRARAEEPDPRLERQGMEDDERIHPAAMRGGDDDVAAVRGTSSRPSTSTWNRNRPNRTTRATIARAGRAGDAFASGGRPSQSRPSVALPRAAASASGAIRPGGGRRRRRVDRRRRSLVGGSVTPAATSGLSSGGASASSTADRRSSPLGPPRRPLGPPCRPSAGGRSRLARPPTRRSGSGSWPAAARSSASISPTLGPPCR